MPNPIKEALLNRGWAGKTITRAETVERLNPLVRQFLRLNHNYQYVIRSHADSAVTKALKRVQKTARADVGKLSETILSCGGTPENGTDMEADDVDLGDDNVGMLRQLRDLETDLNDAVGREREEIEHQMRTRGILDALKSNSAERLELLSDLIDRAEAAAK
jgi:type I site-specific restriction endonuclease